jgi:3-isopropylmalate dehydrogenase
MGTSWRVAVLPGDGIGPEVTREAVKVLSAYVGCSGAQLSFYEAPCGGAAIDLHGEPLPEEVVTLCESSDALLLGAVGGQKWDDFPRELRPEQALLRLRKHFCLFVNLRPIHLYPCLEEASPLKSRVITGGVNLVICRELTGGLYFGLPRCRIPLSQGGFQAVDTMVYTSKEISRIVKAAFELAQKRNRKLASVDKANVLECSKLWRQIVQEMAGEYPDVDVRHLYVDDCAAKLVQYPYEFDVIVTENTFGDILSDLGAVLTGSMGLLPSASLGNKKDGSHFGLYEPVHGSAPDIAGKGIANPVAAILSAAMMLEHSFGMKEGAEIIEKAVHMTIEKGFRTADLVSAGGQVVSTPQMGDEIALNVERICTGQSD